MAIAVALVATRVAYADDEVVVHGTKTADPAKVSLSTEETRKVPGAFGDPFRVIDALPGALPFEVGAPYPIVRGAPPGNTATLIDGIPVPLLFHLGFGPAVVHPELISHVDYFAGSAPARYGRIVGGVIAASLREPEIKPRIDAHVRAFDAGALVEAPLLDGHADAMVAGRYSYTAAALSLFSPGVDVGYWDYQARAGIDVGAHDRASVFAFGSHDRRGELRGFGTTTFASDFHRVDVRYDRSLGGSDRVRVAGTVGSDRSGNEQASVNSTLVRARLELERRLGETLLVRAGADATFTHSLAGSAEQPQLAATIASIYPAHDDTVSGVYADLVWRPIPRLEIVPGARVDLYDWRLRNPPPPDVSESLPTTSAATIEPRLAARFGLSERVAMLSTIALFDQPPSFFVPIPGLQPASFSQGLQKSLHRSLGVEVMAPASITATATAFWHENQNTTSFSTCSIPAGGFDITSGCIARRSHGAAYGVELFVKRPLTKRLGGFVSYTLSRSEEQSLFIDTRTFDLYRDVHATSFDHTHVLNVVASYDLGRRWNAGARLLHYTGRPATFTERLSSFTRLDVRLEKRWPFFTTGWIAFVAEGLNVTFAREEETSPTGSPTYGSPVVIPSIGLEASY